MNELIKQKQLMKKKLPNFRRVEKHRHPALPDNWRKPKGHHSKIRRGKKWEMRIPKIGMKTPRALQNFDKFGREFIMIKDSNDLKNLNEKTVGIIVAGLGLKKKLIIANSAKGKNHKFLNFNPEKTIEKANKMIESKKKEKSKEAPKIKEAAEQKAQKPSKEAAAKPAKPTKEAAEKPAKPKAAAEKPKAESKEGSE